VQIKKKRLEGTKHASGKLIFIARVPLSRIMCNRMERNDTMWLTKMKSFCEELQLYIRSKNHMEFPETVPSNEKGVFDNLCEMSTECTYMSEIDIKKHNAIIFEVQSMARKLLVEIATHHAMAFRGESGRVPFFEKPLFTALALAVEHQDMCKNIDNNLREALSICS
jgi:hypothetical protein